jgi:hypothetical protein
MRAISSLFAPGSRHDEPSAASTESVAIHSNAASSDSWANQSSAFATVAWLLRTARQCASRAIASSRGAVLFKRTASGGNAGTATTPARAHANSASVKSTPGG